MRNPITQYKTLITLMAGILVMFLVRTILAVQYHPPRRLVLFDTLIVLVSTLVLMKWHRSLLIWKRLDPCDNLGLHG